MTDLERLARLPDDFDGQVRLFPLPGTVLFPHVMQPLHVFEPRYCDLLADSLASDRLIAMAVLAPGWEASYEQQPALEEHVCIGRVVTHTRSDEDRHNILLLGIRRARIVAELSSGQTYRTARVEILDDVYPPSGAAGRARKQKRLLEAFRRLIPEHALAQENFRQLLACKLPLGPVTDIVAFSCALPAALKLELLGQTDVDVRAELLLRELTSHLPVVHAPSAEEREGFPPPFSRN